MADPYQLSLELRPGLVERHRSLLDCVQECVLTNGNPLKTIAADMDLSSTELSKKLARDPKRGFTLDNLEKFISVTGDVTPILYLAGKYIEGEEVKKRAAISALGKLIPHIQALLKEASV